MKDVPYELPEGFSIVAMPVREDVRDAFVSMNGLKFKDLPPGARIGTSSRRRATQLALLRPDIEIVPIRGNVQTRISKIESENLHGIILASAGLKRLGMECIITDYFTEDEMVPAIGQGALGIEIYDSCAFKKELGDLDDKDIRVCVEAERSFMKELKGDCHSTIGAYAKLDGDNLRLIGIYEVNGILVKKVVNGNKTQSIELGKQLALEILQK